MKSAPRNLLVIGIDGARWDIASEDGVAVNLLRLADEGSFHQMTMEAPTFSGPGWASILTGTTHAEHGASENTMTGANMASHPDLLSKAFYRDQSTRTFAAAGWPVLVDPAGPGPVIHERIEQQKAGQHRVIVRDGETLGYERVDAEIVDFSIYALNSGFDVGFVYCCDVDDAGHVYGLGQEYRDALRRVDNHVSRIMETLASSDAEWLVVLTTDHGHRDEGGHGGDSDREKESWVIAWATDGALPDWPEHIAPHELAELMLNAR